MNRTMESLLELDREILVAINGWYSPLADSIMLFFTGAANWIPLYLMLAALMFVPKWYGTGSYMQQCRSSVPVWVIGLSALAAAGVCFGLTDQLSNLVKNTVCRLRPTHEPLLEGCIRIIAGEGGLYGFNSAHAANTMGLAVLTSLIFRKRWFTVLMVFWSLVTCYSRIYLARHYLGDILAGILLGVVAAYVVYCVWVVVLGKISRHRDAVPSR